MKAILVIAILPLLFANFISIVSPVEQILQDNSTIFLGSAAPGESIYIEASSRTVFNNTIYDIGWSQMKAIALPEGWESTPTKLYENPIMKLQIKIPTNAKLGMNALKIFAYNAYNKQNITFFAFVNVTNDIFDARVQNYSSSGVMQPLQYSIEIRNKGISDDPFVINCSLPIGCSSIPVVVLHNTTRKVTYELILPDAKRYNFNISISLLYNPKLIKNFGVVGDVKQEIKYDFIATSQGALISPIVEAPIYNLLALIFKIFKI